MKQLYLLLFIVLVVINPAFGVDKYVFAVKGGISLGSYEAGLNWVYVEQLRKLRASGNANLDTFVGASAGSINTLLSAIRYCQNDSIPLKTGQHLFKNTWNVGIQDFVKLPGSKTTNKANNEQTFADLLNNLQQGLFSRDGLQRSLEFVKEQLIKSKGNYRPDCQIKLGIAVTKLIPDSETISGIEILNQRYIIPLTISIVDGELTFFNLDPQDQTFIHQDKYIYLPENNGKVSSQQIFRAILASSAFPITFSPIQLRYCKVNSNSQSRLDSSACPEGYSEYESLFIDGGNFDNAPIGSAMKINDPDEKYTDAVFTLINPSKKRSRNKSEKTRPSKNTQRNSKIRGIQEYLELGYHIIDYGMSAELYQTARRIALLQRKSNSQRPSIKVTDRYFPVVGDYLLHFGAFFDKQFREYDFAVGIYDGVINLAEYQCMQKLPKQKIDASIYLACVGSESLEIVKYLALDNSDALGLFMELGQREFIKQKNSKAWSWLWNTDINNPNNTLTNIYHAMTDHKCVNKDSELSCKQSTEAVEFDDFLQNIKRYEPSLASYEEHTKHIIESKRSWKYPIFNHALDRTYEIEQQKYASTKVGSQERKNQKNVIDILKMSTYVGKTYFSKNETGLWPNSTLHNPFWSFFTLVPDEIGISYRQTSVYLKYKKEMLISRGKLPFGFESRFVPINWTSRTRNTNKFMGAEFVLKTHTSNPLFSTFGVGYGYYNVEFYGNDLNGKLDSFGSPLHGIIVDFGAIAGKIKTSIIYRGDAINKDNKGYVNWAVNLGLSDIKGLRWLW